MAAVTAQMVKELRDKTGAGMMDCKKALMESDGDEEKAIESLRKKGLSKAAKKAGRATGEGLVGYAAKGDAAAAMVELQCETDFVARNEKFQETLTAITESVLDSPPTCGHGHEVVHSPDDQCFLNHVVAADKTVQDMVNDLIATLGENMQAGRYARLELDSPGIIGSYIHANGKIGVIVELKTLKEESAGKAELQELGKDVAMQIAAANPVCVSSDDVPAELIEKERNFFRERAIAEGKPEKILDKIVEGGLNKYYKEVCLLNQPFIKDDKKSIEALLKEVGKSINDTITLGRFARLQLGEEA